MTFRLSNQMPYQSRLVEEKEEVKRKFFFVIEGEKTENIYIQKVSQNVKKEALIEVHILERIQSSHSNQYKITSTIKKYLETHEQLSEDIKVQLLDLSIKYEDEDINESQLLDSLKQILGDALESLIIQHNENVIEQIRTLNELNKYEKDFDKICLILDRDYRSFKNSQYDRVLEICHENNFLLGITNPNFEFYLLLHIDDATTLDQEKLKNNPRITSQKKYVEHTLNNKLFTMHNLSYKKNNYDANFFIGKFSNFKENIVNYSDDNLVLKNEIGSSVHHIINHLLD